MPNQVEAIPAGTQYKTVAASQTGQTLGANGAIGDYLEGVLILVATAATAAVTIKDGGSTTVVSFANSPGGGVGSYYLPIKAKSVAGAWNITTGAGSTVLATGIFS